MAARRRRTHAERTARTRARIVEAVVASMASVGYARSTAPEITRRAGVTWGAVQHQFGDKHGMFVAVLEHSFERFAARLSDLPADDLDLEKRASLFLERAWEHFASAHHRAASEIMLNYLGREDEAARRDWQGEMFRAFDRVWMEFFGEAPIPRRRHVLLQHYTVSALSGLASTLALEGADARPRPGELDLLVATLARELTRGRSSFRPSGPSG